MALRPRNIALEGFADDFIDPLTIALVGFASEDAVAASIVETGPAQTETITARQPVGGAAIWVPIRRKTPPAISAFSEAPAQVEAIAVECERLSLKAKRAARKRRSAARKRELAPQAVTISEASPAQREAITAEAPIVLSVSEASPAQREAITASVYRSRPALSRASDRLAFREAFLAQRTAHRQRAA